MRSQHGEQPQAKRSGSRPSPSRSEVGDGMRIDWNVSLRMDDGVLLSGDVFRPVKEGRYPVILTYGPYAKGLAFQDGYPSAWQRMAEKHPDVTAGSSNKYQNWEVVDPEKWVPHAYACMRVDFARLRPLAGVHRSFLAARNPGFLRLHRMGGETALVERQNRPQRRLLLRHQPMARGVPAAAPPRRHVHLGRRGRLYRDMTHHGGILCTFWENWYDMQVKTVQYGAGERGKKKPRHRRAGRAARKTCPTRSSRSIAAISAPSIREHPLDDEYHKERSPNWSKIKVPLLTAANWGGQGLHPRGNFEGFVRAAAKQKWLEAHGLEHWTHFYTDYGRQLQLEFFDHFLHGKNNGWDKRPRVLLQVRHLDGFVAREENEWPLARTKWTKLYLDPADAALDEKKSTGTAALSFEAMGKGLTFLTAPLDSRGRDHRPFGAEALRFLLHQRRRSLRRPAGVFSRSPGGRLPRRHRPAHAHWPGLAQGLASQARQEAVAPLSTLPYARPASSR